MISDPTAEAQRVYEAAIRAMTPAERVAMCMEMIAVTDNLLRAGIRLRFSEAGAEEFEHQSPQAKYGKELARQVYGRSA